ncbi:MAG TPA: helix-turn-helix domain-containing protein [Desulfuromonadales bacterium]|nr:helix-turn-helix domain-containing protein [Desulfuromonadales bacterium]
MNLDKVEIGKRFREIRRRLNMTQRKFGELLGVVPSAVSAYESGSKFPSPESLGRIVEIGGVSFDWLLAGGPPPAATGQPPLGRQTVQMSGHLETTGEARVSEMLAGFTTGKPIQLSAQERRLLLQFRLLPAERQEKLIEDIELINVGLQRRTSGWGGSENEG